MKKIINIPVSIYFGILTLASCGFPPLSRLVDLELLAGDIGGPGNEDGTGIAARFNQPHGVAVDAAGNVYVADEFNYTVRKITAAGDVTTLAGKADMPGSADGTGTAARFNAPRGIAIDSAGNLYVADETNSTIRKITATGVVTTLAGTPGMRGSADGTGAAAQFNKPSDVAVDSDGNVYVADESNDTIRRITPDGAVMTLAGTAGVSGTADGMGAAARFSVPCGVAVDRDGTVYVADIFNDTIRKISLAGEVTTLAGAPGMPGAVDGVGAAARFGLPCGVAVNSAGDAVTLGLVSTAGAQEMATDRVEAIMLAGGRDVLPIHEEKLTVDIDGEYASATLVQTYLNNTSGRIEGNYKLRPGSGSHVDGFAYWNGEQKIVGEVFERQTAHQVYNQVTARKRDPGLLEADGEGAFAFKVFPVEPHENKRVEVRWTKWLERHAQAVHFRAPVTSRDAEIVVQISGPVKNVRSSTHKFRVEKLDDGVRLRSQGSQTGPGGPGEIDLDWDLDEASWTPDVYVQRAAGRDEGWFALALAAPKLPENTVTAKDMMIVIDHSGSMMLDDKMEHAKLAAADMIRMLNPSDRVNVISFSDEVDPLFKAPQALDKATRQDAVAFVNRLHATGGTDIALALKTAVASQDKKSEHPKVVVFLTDGQSDAAQAAAVQTGDVRLFTLGLGTDVNRPLLQRLAAEKRGRFVFIEDARSIEREVGRLATNISKPLLVDISIDIDGANPTRVYPRTLPDLFAEDELRVSGRMRGAGPVKFVIRGKLAGKQIELTRTVDLDKAPNRAWTAALWAQSRIDHLLEEISLDGTKQELKDEVLELALAYNVVTPYTAFLAVPESELGAARDTVMAARERKRKIQLDNDQLAMDRSSGNTAAAIPSAAPANDPASTTPGVTLSQSYTRNAPAPHPISADVGDDDDNDAPKHAHKAVASRADDGEADMAPRTSEAVQSGHHGCAGCATGSGNGAASFLLFGWTALLVRRRRR